jgi:tripartite-type tricarboxylate transporter receptor subunit TctC
VKLKQVLAGAAVVFLAAGCGSSGSASNNSSGKTESADAYFKSCHNTIQFVVGYTAGGATDVWARLLADALGKETGAKFQVVNAPGAGGSIGINKVTSAKPDGCTIGNVNLPSGLQYLLPGSKVTYSKDDLSLIGESGYSPNAIVISAKSKYETVADFIADAKARPGKVNAASDGPGSDDAIAYAQLQDAAGIKINQVVLNGSADKVTSLLGGQIDLFGGSVTGVLPNIKNNQIRVLCVYADQPSTFVPDAPTCSSQGVDVSSDNRWSIFTGKNVPENRRKILEDALLTVAKNDDYKSANEKAGVEVVPLTGKELSDQWDKEADTYKKVVAELPQ